MLEKIPFSSLKNHQELEIEEKLIKCPFCNGILYEPIFSTKKGKNCCKSCLLSQNNIEQENLSINYSHLFKPISKQIKNKLNNYEYICPLEYMENTEGKQYNYDELINHLIICDNNKIKCPSCGADKFLKNILEKNEKKKLTDILINNKILERELEYQKSVIVEMENEKKKTNVIVNKKEKEKDKKENILINTKEKKENKKVNLKKVISNNKLTVKKVERENSKKITKIKKGSLPPIKTKRKIIEEKQESPSNLNFKFNHKIKEKPEEIYPNNSNNTTLFDKCPHFYGNYMPKFACCDKFYGCYLCHNENEDHPFIFSNEVSCLFCENIYQGKKCTKCKANRKFRKKYLNFF